VASDPLMEQQIEFPGPAGLLEGRSGNESAAKHGAVIALHPHPLYGGSMNNNVVETIVRAGQSSGLLTLRFNFRGVGRSEGDYSDGTGPWISLNRVSILEPESSRAIPLVQQ
jgi:alpha/beta superfamily hydrolase